MLFKHFKHWDPLKNFPIFGLLQTLFCFLFWPEQHLQLTLLCFSLAEVWNKENELINPTDSIHPAYFDVWHYCMDCEASVFALQNGEKVNN